MQNLSHSDTIILVSRILKRIRISELRKNQNCEIILGNNGAVLMKKDYVSQKQMQYESLTPNTRRRRFYLATLITGIFLVFFFYLFFTMKSITNYAVSSVEEIVESSAEHIYMHILMKEKKTEEMPDSKKEDGIGLMDEQEWRNILPTDYYGEPVYSFLLDEKNQIVISTYQGSDKETFSCTDNQLIGKTLNEVFEDESIGDMVDKSLSEAKTQGLGAKAILSSCKFGKTIVCADEIKDTEYTLVGLVPADSYEKVQKQNNFHFLVATVCICVLVMVYMYGMHSLNMKERKMISELNQKLEEDNRKINEENRSNFKDLQEAIVLADKANQTKSSFLFNMSHDIREPINSIAGLTELLENSADEPSKVREYTSKIRSSNDYIASIVDDVLEIARIESKSATIDNELTDLVSMLEEISLAFEDQIQRKQIKFETSMKAEHSYVYADRAKMKKVIFKLLSNACKYTNEGGTITLKLRELSFEEGKGLYQIVVEDDGIGMSPELKNHIFEMFDRRNDNVKTNGTGLSMKIVKNLVDIMGGTIYADSAVNEGSRFEIKISFKCATEEEIENYRNVLSDSGKGYFSGKRVLITEDNELNAEILAAILEEQGFCVEFAADGEECVEKVYRSSEGYYDLILMDIQMPNMNGYQATRKIRRMWRTKSNIPIIAMSGNTREDVKPEVEEAGMNAFLPKPIDVDELTATISEFIK